MIYLKLTHTADLIISIMLVNGASYTEIFIKCEELRVRIKRPSLNSAAKIVAAVELQIH